jgi:transcriptional regulator with XRE-family HTH domain
LKNKDNEMNEEEFVINTGKLLKLVRLDKNLSQEELAELCGLTQNTISAYETGVHAMNIGRLHSVAQALGLTAKQLLPESQKLQIPQDAENIDVLTDPRILCLIQKAKELTTGKSDSEPSTDELFKILSNSLSVYIAIMTDERIQEDRRDLEDILTKLLSKNPVSQQFSLKMLIKLILSN